MDKPKSYTLEELAADFDLTPRTARHYIENVLPPHHKTGRGKLARYGQDTWNCFAFIQKVRQQSGFTAAQLTEVMANLDQAQIDRVADGREDLRVVTSPIAPAVKSYSPKSFFRKASERAASSKRVEEMRFSSDSLSDIFAAECPDLSRYQKARKEEAPGSWKTLYADDRLRISFKGEVNRDQVEQLDLAAKLILKILAGNR